MHLLNYQINIIELIKDMCHFYKENIFYDINS